MNDLFVLAIGVLAGIFLSALALVWDSSRDKPQIVRMDENYKLHLVKKRKRNPRSIIKGDIVFYDADRLDEVIPPKKKMK